MNHLFSELMVNDDATYVYEFHNSYIQQAGQASYTQSKMATCCALIYNKISILKFETCRLSLLFSKMAITEMWQD